MRDQLTEIFASKMSASTMTTARDFHGIYASTVCPLQARRRDRRGRRSSAHLRAVLNGTGMRGLLVNGHAGENAVLVRAEHRRVIEIARRAGNGCLIVAGINSESSEAAALLARDAAEAGADAVMVFAPFSWALGADPRVIVQSSRDRARGDIAAAVPVPGLGARRADRFHARCPARAAPPAARRRHQGGELGNLGL